MKNNDLSFAFLSLIILAGMIAACLPSARAKHPDVTTPAAALVQHAHSATKPNTATAYRAQS